MTHTTEKNGTLPRHSVPRSVAGDPHKAPLNELNPRAFSLVAPLRLPVNHLWMDGPTESVTHAKWVLFI